MSPICHMERDHICEIVCQGLENLSTVAGRAVCQDNLVEKSIEGQNVALEGRDLLDVICTDCVPLIRLRRGAYVYIHIYNIDVCCHTNVV